MLDEPSEPAEASLGSELQPRCHSLLRPVRRCSEEQHSWKDAPPVPVDSGGSRQGTATDADVLRLPGSDQLPLLGEQHTRSGSEDGSHPDIVISAGTSVCMSPEVVDGSM